MADQTAARADLRDSVEGEITEWIKEMPDGLDQQTEAARQRIGRLSRQFERVLTRVAAAHGLTVGDLEALSVLARSGPPYQRTPKQLTEILGLTTGTVSVRVDRLTRAGLVEPAIGAADGRSRPIRLTQHGYQRWRAATAQRTSDEQHLFGSVLDTDDLTALNALLSRLLHRFEEDFGPAPKHDTPRSSA